MADISKDRLRKEIAAILKNADLTKISGKKLRNELEKKLAVDLADQKKIIDEIAMEILKERETSKKDDSEDDDNEENGGAGEDEDEDDEDDNDKGKKKGQKRSIQKKTKDSESDEASDDEDEDEYSPKKKAKSSAKKGAGKKRKKGSDNDSDEDWAKKKGGRSGGGSASKRGGGKGGYTKPCTLSPELAKLVGQETMPRHEVVKKIWAIIKERNLFDPNNKQFAICDSELAEVFVVKRFRTFGMMKYLKNHFIT